MPRDDIQLKLRLPPNLKAKIDAAAVANTRSLNSEILARLDASFGTEDRTENLRRALEDLRSKYEELDRRTEENWQAFTAVLSVARISPGDEALTIPFQPVEDWRKAQPDEPSWPAAVHRLVEKALSGSFATGTRVRIDKHRLAASRTRDPERTE